MPRPTSAMLAALSVSTAPMIAAGVATVISAGALRSAISATVTAIAAPGNATAGIAVRAPGKAATAITATTAGIVPRRAGVTGAATILASTTLAARRQFSAGPM